LHAKVAVVDPEGPRPWATVGSSNLEPLSLLLAHEANLIIEDGGFARALHERLGDAIRRDARAIDGSDLAARRWHQRLLDAVALMLVRLGIALIGRSY
jgi:cardiolipin synthase